MQQLGRQLREKLTVLDATFGRCGEKSCDFRCNHTTTVAVYCQCYYMQQLGRQLREKLTVTGVTTGRSNEKICG